MEAKSLEARLSELEAALATVVARLDTLEASAGAPGTRAGAPAPAAEVTEESAEAPERFQSLLGLAGRTCLILGGAFLVRSLTDSGALSKGLGVGVGLAYALVWLVFADRAAAKGLTTSGVFHALASALLVYPLLFEATTRFGLLAPWPAAALLVAVTSIGLFVAWRRSFHLAAWITLVGALGAGVLLLFQTRTPLPFVTALLIVAVFSLVLAYGRGWRGQRWLVAVSIDLVVLLLGLLLLVGRRAPDWLTPTPVLCAQLGLVIVYLAAFTLRLLVQGRVVTPFAVAQTIVVLGLGFEGALLLAGPALRTAIAAAAIAAGALLHGVLARRSERVWGHGPAVGYFATVATFLAAEGARILLPAPTYPVLWMAAAAVLGALSLPGARPILQVHAALLTLAGGVASGLLPAAVAALSRGPRREWPAAGVDDLAALALAALTAWFLYRGACAGPAAGVSRAARLVSLCVALLGLGGLLVRLAAAELADAPGAGADLGLVAVLRTAVVAVAAVALATAAGVIGKPELARLATAVLVLGGFKVLVEDLRVGAASHLVFSLALYGTALIVAPLLGRRARRPTPAP